MATIEDIRIEEHNGQCYMTATIDGVRRTRPISGCVLNDYWNSSSEETDKDIAEGVFAD